MNTILQVHVKKNCKTNLTCSCYNVLKFNLKLTSLLSIITDLPKIKYLVFRSNICGPQENRVPCPRRVEGMFSAAPY